MLNEAVYGFVVWYGPTSRNGSVRNGLVLITH